MSSQNKDYKKRDRNCKKSIWHNFRFLCKLNLKNGEYDKFPPAIKTTSEKYQGQYIRLNEDE